MEWREIPGFPEYAASERGDVQRVWPDQRNHKISGAGLKPVLCKSGYYQVSLSRDGKSHSRRLNRVICETFHGPAPSNRHHAAHADGVKSNNHKDNLRWATARENESDKVGHGTVAAGLRHGSRTKPSSKPIGHKHGLAKLDDKKVAAIRTDPRSQREIAKAFGVSQKTIMLVKKRVTWRHVP